MEQRATWTDERLDDLIDAMRNGFTRSDQGIRDLRTREVVGLDQPELSRSALDWIVDRYQVKTDKASGIVNDPNDLSKEVGDPRYIIDLFARIVTVSLRTMKIVNGLPALNIREDQGAGKDEAPAQVSLEMS